MDEMTTVFSVIFVFVCSFAFVNNMHVNRKGLNRL